MNMMRGMRDRLEKYISVNAPFNIRMSVDSPDECDFCCFGVDSDDRLSDDRYMIFYNQTISPLNEITYRSSGNTADFTVNLAALPPSVNKLVFTVSIDGESTVGNMKSHSFRMIQGGSDVLEMNLDGSDFTKEKAIITVEIYKKEVWRINAVARGFFGGIGDLLKSYGGEASSSPEPPQPVQPPRAAKVSLEKKLAAAPALVSLAKPLTVELEKRNLLDVVARVALVMDISGSMSGRYRNGTVQSIVNKVLPIAVQFDDDGELEFWYYGSRCRRMESVNLRNYQSAVPPEWHDIMKALGFGNNEVNVMGEVCEEFKETKVPAYVIFVTDGGVGNAKGIKKMMTEASYMPIFWQFVGVGGKNYGILEEFDDMEGRYVDNADFFALDDFNSVPDSELYSRLLNEFPQWLAEIKRKNMI